MTKKLFPEPGQSFGEKEAKEYARIQDSFLKSLDGSIGMVGIVAAADGSMYLIARARPGTDGTEDQVEQLVLAKDILHALLDMSGSSDEDSILSTGMTAVKIIPRKGHVH